MLSFKEYLEERKVDPVELGKRASKIYGKRKSFGKWEKVEKGGHLPLSNYDARKSNSAASKLMKVQTKLGMESRDKDEREKGKKLYDAHHQRKTMKIKDLHATQKYVETSDTERLKSKIADKNPGHIHVVTHKGVHYVADGHHAVMAAKLRGEKSVEVNHIDLDKFK